MMVSSAQGSKPHPFPSSSEPPQPPPTIRHSSVSPTQSSPASAASSRSGTSSNLAFGSLSAGSASWVGSDGTAATSEHGSPAHPASASTSSSSTAGPASSIATTSMPVDVASKTKVFNPPSSFAGRTETSATTTAEAERLRRSISTPSFREARTARERTSTSPGIKRKASGGSTSARTEKVEGRSIDMRRVPTPSTATAPANQEELQEPMNKEDQDEETMRDVSGSPESERKLRRRRDRSGTVVGASELRRPQRRRRKPKSTRFQSTALSIDPSPSSDPVEVPTAPPDEPGPHIDLANYPQQELLRLLASLLSQIATANDALRNDQHSNISPPSSSVSVSALGGSSASLASTISSPAGGSTRRVVAAAEPPRSAGSTGRRESRSPWNSMPSTPYREKSGFAFTSHSAQAQNPAVSVLASGASSLSHPPTPGASRANSPTATRRGSLNAMTSSTEIPADDFFSASRTALTSRSATLAFHARNVPQITIEAYLLRILKYCPTSNEVFISLLVYFDRMARQTGLNGRALSSGSSSGSASPVVAARRTASGEEGREQQVQEQEAKPFAIDSFNVHRLVIAGVTVASKFFSDVFYTNSRYAKVGGLPLYELDQLELQFLLINDFRLVIPLEEMQRYADQLLMHWDGARGTCGYREPRPPASKSPSRLSSTTMQQAAEDDDDDYEDWGSDDDSSSVEEEEEEEAMDDSGELQRRHVVDLDVDEAARTVSSASLAPSRPSPRASTPAVSLVHHRMTSDESSEDDEGEAEDVTTRPRAARSQPSTSRLSIASGQSSEASASTVTPGTPRGGADRDASEESSTFGSVYDDEGPWRSSSTEDMEMDG